MAGWYPCYGKNSKSVSQWNDPAFWHSNNQKLLATNYSAYPRAHFKCALGSSMLCYNPFHTFGNACQEIELILYIRHTLERAWKYLLCNWNHAQRKSGNLSALPSGRRLHAGLRQICCMIYSGYDFRILQPEQWDVLLCRR